MAVSGSVTRWIARLQMGEAPAATELWERYSRRLIALARRRLGPSRDPATDEEDVVQSAFNSFCRAVGSGRLPDLQDRQSLWNVLFALTSRKVMDVIRHNSRRKRHGGGERVPLTDLASRQASPQELAAIEDEFRRLFDLLPDKQLRAVAVARLEGYTATEIAEHLGCTVRTVERKLRVIRRLWTAGEDGGSE